MPEQVKQDIEKNIAQLEELAKLNGDLRVKDLLWPMMAMARAIDALAEVHVKCEARSWYNTWSRWANMAVGGVVVALIVWLINFALTHGFTVPTP